ncbi:hypothetical protein LTR85_006435 [Meristemomyces frigidus]|nr:hypothetical protein LTR85_006435 [Meristemomyces frigidus]
MLPPVDASIMASNPRFDALYRDLCANKLNADGSSRLDTKAVKERQAFDEDLHKARIEVARRATVTTQLQNLRYYGEKLPDELQDLVGLTAATLSGGVAADDQEVVADELERLQEHARTLAKVLSKQLEQDANALAKLLVVETAPSHSGLPASLAKLIGDTASSRTNLADSRLLLARDVSALHDLYRQVMQASIRVLEQTIHGSVARGTKAKAEHLAVVAEGMSKKLSLQYGQLIQQVYSPDTQEMLRAKAQELEAETSVLRRRVREAEEKVAEYRQARGMKDMVREYAEIMTETQKVRDEVERLTG